MRSRGGSTRPGQSPPSVPSRCEFVRSLIQSLIYGVDVRIAPACAKNEVVRDQRYLTDVKNKDVFGFSVHK